MSLGRMSWPYDLQLPQYVTNNVSVAPSHTNPVGCCPLHPFHLFDLSLRKSFPNRCINVHYMYSSVGFVLLWASFLRLMFFVINIFMYSSVSLMLLWVSFP